MTMPQRPINRVLVANRGEIACRILRTLKDKSIEGVAVYSEADTASLHVRLADWAVALEGVSSTDTYLNIDKLLEAARATECDAVHPGYGFLSENSSFARQVEEAGLTFIGPSYQAMEAMGDKVQAKALMRDIGVPVVPGSNGELSSLTELTQLVDDIGLPVIIKAAAGGGGRGMRVVRKMDDLQDAYDACRREAQNYFANPSVFCERYLSSPRHIEFQVLFDSHGNGIHLFERDCSIQRRHQKLFEEAPSTFLDDDQRKNLGLLAVKAAKAVDYRGAGTVEFICDVDGSAYFMEMNTRIQVEHPVTEWICGVDLIAAQIDVACGHPLPWRQDEVTLSGWAFEARINAEDVAKGFLPQAGRISHLHLPAGPCVRVDTHIYPGYEVGTAYDSMLAKIITWGPDRATAGKRMLRALAETQIDGISTTCCFHERLCRHERFIAGDFDTGFVQTHEAELTKSETPNDDQIGAICAALAQLQRAHPTLPNPPRSSEWGQAAIREAVGRTL